MHKKQEKSSSDHLLRRRKCKDLWHHPKRLAFQVEWPKSLNTQNHPLVQPMWDYLFVQILTIPSQTKSRNLHLNRCAALHCIVPAFPLHMCLCLRLRHFCCTALCLHCTCVCACAFFWLRCTALCLSLHLCLRLRPGQCHPFLRDLSYMTKFKAWL